MLSKLWNAVLSITTISILLLFCGIWIAQIVRLSHRKDKSLMVITIFLGIFLTPIGGGLIGLFLGRDPEIEK